jgi:hypothetical protein
MATLGRPRVVYGSAAMSERAFDFLQSWMAENVKATMYEHQETVENLTDDCVWEAKTRGIMMADLIEAAGGNLNAYMLAEFNRAGDRKVENKVLQDAS